MTITKQQVTWMRTGKWGQPRITHPTMWCWTDPDDTERYYDTKAEAVAAEQADATERASL
jgi:hypothetical protein